MADKIKIENVHIQKAKHRGLKKEIFAPVKKDKNDNGLSVDEQNKRLLDKLLSTRSGEELMNQLLSMFPAIHPLLVTASVGHVVGLRKLVNVVAGGINEIRHPKDDSTALHVAAKSGFTEAAKFLLDSGANPSIANNDGNTAFMVAIIHGSAPVVNVLWHVRDRFNINHSNKLGQTSIHLAALRGWDSCINMLLGGGAGKNTTTQEGCTALMICAMRGDMTTTKRLASSGANILLEDNEVSTSICLSIKKDHNVVAQYLLDKLQHNHLEDYVKRRIQLLTLLPDVEETYQFYNDVLYQVFRFLAHHTKARQLLHQHKLLSSWILATYNHTSRDDVTEKAFLYMAELMCVGTQSDVDGRFVEQFLRYGGPNLVLQTMAYYREAGDQEMVACTMVPLLPLAGTAAGEKWLEQAYYKISESIEAFYNNRDDLDYPPGMKEIANKLWNKFSDLFTKIQAIQAELHGAELLATEERDKERQRVRRDKRREKKKQKRQRARSRSVGAARRSPGRHSSESDSDSDILQNPIATNVQFDDDHRKENPITKNGNLQSQKKGKDSAPNHQSAEKKETSPWGKISTSEFKPAKADDVFILGSHMPEAPDSSFELVLPKKKAKELRKLRQQTVIIKTPDNKQHGMQLNTSMIAETNSPIKTERPKKKSKNKKVKPVDLPVCKINVSLISDEIKVPLIKSKDMNDKLRQKTNHNQHKRPSTPECWDTECNMLNEVVKTAVDDSIIPERTDTISEAKSSNAWTTVNINTVKSSSDPGLNNDQRSTTVILDEHLCIRPHQSASLDNMLLFTDDHEIRSQTTVQERRHHRRSRSDTTTLQLLWGTSGIDTTPLSTTRSQPNNNYQARKQTKLTVMLDFHKMQHVVPDLECKPQAMPIGHNESSISVSDPHQVSDTLDGKQTPVNTTEVLQVDLPDTTATETDPAIERQKKKKRKLRRRKSQKGTTQTLQQFLQSNAHSGVDTTTYSNASGKIQDLQMQHQDQVTSSAWSEELCAWAADLEGGKDTAHKLVAERVGVTLCGDLEVSCHNQQEMFLGDASIDETLDNSMSFNTDISSIDDSFLITDTEQDDGHTKDRITVSAGIQNHNCFVTPMEQKHQHNGSRLEDTQGPVHMNTIVVPGNTCCTSVTVPDQPSYDFSSAVMNLQSSMFQFGGNFSLLSNEYLVPDAMGISDSTVVQCAAKHIPGPPPGFAAIYGSEIESPLQQVPHNNIVSELNSNDIANTTSVRDLPVNREQEMYDAFYSECQTELANDSTLSHRVTNVTSSPCVPSTSSPRIPHTSSPRAMHNISVPHYNSNDLLYKDPSLCFEPIDPLWSPRTHYVHYPLDDVLSPEEMVSLPKPVSPEFSHLTPDPDVIYDNDPERDSYIMGHIRREWIGQNYFSPADKLTELIDSQKDLVRQKVEHGNAPARRTYINPCLEILAGRLPGGGDYVNNDKHKQTFSSKQSDSIVSHFWLPSWILND